jgi:hypothetical protein
MGKNIVYVKSLVFRELAEAVELFPDYSIVQHICHVIRKKGAGKDPYFLSDNDLLTRLETYVRELKEEQRAARMAHMEAIRNGTDPDML